MSDEYSAPTSRRWLAAVAGLQALALAILVVPAYRHWTEAAPPAPLSVRAVWSAPNGLAIGAGSDFPFGLALAPDGRRLAFPAARDGHVQLYLQDLRTGTATALPGTDGSVLPFWSPDGVRIGFAAGGMLRAIDTDTLAVSDVLAAESPRGASWTTRGDLVTATSAEGGLTLLTSAGTSRALTTLDRAAGEIAHLFPTALPDGRHVVYFVRAEAPSRQGLWLAALDGETPPTRITGAASHALAVGPHLIFANDGALVAQGLDTASGSLAGPATVLGVSVGASPLGQLLATAADDTLIYSPPLTLRRELVWMSPEGERLGTVGSPADTWAIRIAPDGRRVAATVLDPLLRTLDVVLYDGATVMPTRLSLSIDADDTPVWSPDGLRVAWVQAGRAVMIRGAGAVLPAETRIRFAEPVRVTDWTRDGAGLVVSRTMAGTREDLWLVPVGAGEPRPLVETPFADVQGVLSPDGRWLAYASDESGQFEVYVERVRDRSPEPATRERVTSGGGSDPRWSRDGRALFFRRGSAIHVAMPALGRGQDARAATSMVVETRADIRSFDVAPDGRRFLVNVPASPEPSPAPTLVVHWRAVPAPARRP